MDSEFRIQLSEWFRRDAKWRRQKQVVGMAPRRRKTEASETGSWHFWDFGQARRARAGRARRRRNRTGATAARGGRDGQERRGELLVEAEKKFHALAVGIEFFRTVTFLHGAVEFRMGVVQFRRHGVGIVQVGQRAQTTRRQMRRTRIQHRLRFFLHAFPLLRRRRRKLL